MAVTKRTFGMKGGKRILPELEGLTQIFDFGGVFARPYGAQRAKGVAGAWRSVGEAMQAAIETYDPSVKFEPATLIGRCTATEVRKLQLSGAFDKRRYGANAVTGVPVHIKMVVATPKVPVSEK